MAKSKENLFNILAVTNFEAIIMNIDQNISLDDFQVKFESGSLGIKN